MDDVFGNHTRPPGTDAVFAKFRLSAGLGRIAVPALEALNVLQPGRLAMHDSREDIAGDGRAGEAGPVSHPVGARAGEARLREDGGEILEKQIGARRVGRRFARRRWA